MYCFVIDMCLKIYKLKQVLSTLLCYCSQLKLITTSIKHMLFNLKEVYNMYLRMFLQNLIH